MLLVLVLLGLAALVAGASEVRKRKAVVDETAQGIEDDLAALDPAARAAVLARLAKDAKTAVQDKATASGDGQG